MPRRFRATLLAALTAVSLAVALVTPAAAHAPTFRAWSAANEDLGSVDTSRRPDPRFHLVAINPGVFPDRMPKTNPLIAAYDNIAFSDPTESHPDHAYARTRDGRKIRSHLGNYLMKPWSDHWRNNLLGEVRDARRRGHHVTYYDRFGLQPYGTPIGPDGRPLSEAQWLNQLDAALAWLKQQHPGHEFVANGAFGPRKWHLTRRVADAGRLSGYAAEQWAQTRPRNLAEWRAQGMMLRHPRMPMYVVAKAWRGDDVQYAAATYMAWTTGDDAFYAYQRRGEDLTRWRGLYDFLAKMGTARGDVHEHQGVQHRHFTEGMVLVNPTGRHENYRLERSYKPLNGRQIGPGTVVQMPPRSARILRHP